MHVHLINAIGTQQVSRLCLLDLSAAIDTIDHNILLSSLSFWFRIHDTVLDWFKSYPVILFIPGHAVELAVCLPHILPSVVFLKVLF